MGELVAPRERLNLEHDANPGNMPARSFDQ
jgi:hypothetical protein